MSSSYEKDLDLNLLRVFVVVAEAGSVTAAAARLYLTQPAVSAALRRLTSSVGEPLFLRAGRGVALTGRGQRLLASARPHLAALVQAALSPATFDPRTTERTVRVGLSDTAEAWLLPSLLRALDAEAPRLRLVILPVHFRSVGDALSSSSMDLAITVAGDVPADTRRQALFHKRFVCLFDPRHARPGRRLTLDRYLAHDHVVVSYNGDLRGFVEDVLGVQRRVRVSLPSFHSVGAVIEGSPMLATVPSVVAREMRSRYPALRTLALPFSVVGAPMEMFWRRAVDDDEVVTFLRGVIARVAKEVTRSLPPADVGKRSARLRPSRA